MKTRTKILILVPSTIIVFAFATIGNQLIKKQQEHLFLKANIEAKTQTIDNILNYKSKSLLAPVNDYSCWDDMVEYVKKPSKLWEERNLNTAISAFSVTNFWIYNNKYKLLYSDFDNQSINYELDTNLISKAFKESPYCHFFSIKDGGLFEITGATIVPSEDTEHKTPAQGYFIVAKQWTDTYIKMLENEMDFKISLSPIENVASSENSIENENLLITKTLNDIYNKKIIQVEFISRNQLANDLASTQKFYYVIVFLLIITFITFFYAIQHWVSVPLKNITESLAQDDIVHIEKLDLRKDEFGKIASLIKNFFEQKIQLEIEIAERTEA